MRRAATFLALLAIFAVATRPLWRPYQVAGHSAYVDLVRVEAFHEAVRHGDLYPRWIPDFYYQYGSPIFNFYAPASYWVVELFRLTGANNLWALKLAYLAFWLAALSGMYVFTREAIDADGAAAAAAAYAVAPYLLVDAYVRVGIAEFACFAWLPWILWGLRRAALAIGGRSRAFAAVAFAGLTLTHNISALIAAPLLGVFVAATADDRRGFWRGMAALALGLGLSAFFWLPALLEMKYVQATPSLTGGFFQFAGHFVAPLELFRRRWGFGPSLGRDGMSRMYGELLWCGVAGAAVMAVVQSRRQEWRAARLPWFLAGAALLCLFMTTAASRPLWRLPLLPFVQFPWRFLLPSTVFGAAAVAVLPRFAPLKWRPLAAWMLAAVAVAASLPFIKARYIFQDVKTNAPVIAFAPEAAEAAASPTLRRPDQYLTLATIRRLGVTSTASNDYLPVGAAPPAQPPAAPAGAVGGEATILAAQGGWPPSIAVEAQAAAPADIVFNHFYFPGWQARIDGAPADMQVESGSGRMVVAIVPGRHRVDVRFGDTPARRAARRISLATFAVWLAQLWALGREKHR